MKRRELLTKIALLSGGLIVSSKSQSTEQKIFHNNNIITCNNINELRQLGAQHNNQIIYLVSYYGNNKPITGGGYFYYDDKDEATPDNGGSCFVTKTGARFKRIIKGSISLSEFGADGSIENDDNAKNNALLFCEENKINLIIEPGRYNFKTPLEWNPQKYSIIGNGEAIFNFSNCKENEYAIIVKGDDNSSGEVWNALIHKMSNLVIEGKKGINGIIINQEKNKSTPGVSFEHIAVNNFDNSVLFGDNEWCISFTKCIFRGRNNEKTTFITVNKKYNACENQSFTECIFNGCNNAIAIRHIHGSCEINFNKCSFDYCSKVLTINNPEAKGIWRYNQCHFEDNGEQEQFTVNSERASFYIDIIGCDWYFTNNIPLTIGTFKSKNKSSRLTIRDIKIPIYSTSADRKKSNLINVIDKNINCTFDGISLESSENDYFNVFSLSQNLIIATESNRDNLVKEIPEWSFSDHSIFLNPTEKEHYEAKIRQNKKFSISGNVFLTEKTEKSFVEISYIDSKGKEIQKDIITLPNKHNTWIRFGKNLTSPLGTNLILISGLRQDFKNKNSQMIANDWTVEQY